MLLFGVSFLIISCQKDDDFSRKETFNEASAKEINIKTIIGQQIPKSITNYLKDKTENTLQFNITNKKIEPLTVQTIASRGVNLEIGTINTSKSVVELIQQIPSILLKWLIMMLILNTTLLLLI